MKKIIILLITLTHFYTFAEQIVIEATILSWVSDCKSPIKCNIPTASHSPVTFNLYIKELYSPGSGDVVQQDFKLEGNRSGVLKAFSVYPRDETGIPPYIQFQFTQSSPSYLLCSHSVKLRMPMSVPPLICAASYNEENLGYTITFKQIEN